MTTQVRRNSELCGELSARGRLNNSCFRSCDQIHRTEEKISLKSTMINSLKHSLLENHKQEIFFPPIGAMQNKRRQLRSASWISLSLKWARERPVWIHDVSWWLIEGLCPWHHSLRVKNCAIRAKHTSTFFFTKRKNLIHPVEVSQIFTSSECIVYFGSTTVAQNTFVSKWEMALVGK